METYQKSINSNRNDQTQKDSLVLEDLPSPFTNTGKIISSKRSNVQSSEAASLAIKALQSKLKRTLDDNDVLKNRIKSGIEDMQKFENRFTMERDKWQKQYGEELKRNTEKEDTLRKQVSQLTRENDDNILSYRQQLKRNEYMEKEMVIINEKLINAQNKINELEKANDKNYIENRTLSESIEAIKVKLESTSAQKDEDEEKYTFIIEQLRNEKTDYLKDIERLTIENDDVHTYIER